MIFAAGIQAEDRLLWQGTTGKVVWKNVGNGLPTDAVFWESSQGETSQLMNSSGRFGFEKALQIDGQICILGGDTLGVAYYWCFEGKGKVWRLTHKAYLGSLNSFKPYVTNLDLESVDHIRATNSDSPEKINLAIEITSIPLCPERPEETWRLVLVDGKILKPNVGIPGAIWDQPLEKILKDHEARKGAASAESSKPSESKPVPAEAQPTSPVGSAKPSAPLQPSTKSESSGYTLMIISGVIVIGMAGLAYRLKRGRRCTVNRCHK